MAGLPDPSEERLGYLSEDSQFMINAARSVAAFSFVLADCWHWTPEEKPEELNRLVLSWLERRYASR